VIAAAGQLVILDRAQRVFEYTGDVAVLLGRVCEQPGEVEVLQAILNGFAVNHKGKAKVKRQKAKGQL
jgi:hypothetical protein